ncbi:hypothetical protein P873_05660 [Arenimonas composti TR7-09 = DSM 18010]|uniref:Uncharacterized protein n=1 Tax=Arenimonas composti TR7-09 = DSM 18010 TaxID=1121013 RepID=A0A091BFX7_9GAMM|nr:hypothetical protein P873_05660 [Arenimonas composti TR7-09 = DSM 18010]
MDFRIESSPAINVSTVAAGEAFGPLAVSIHSGTTRLQLHMQ